MEDIIRSDNLLYDYTFEYNHTEATDYYKSLVTTPTIKRSNVVFCIIFCAMACFVAITGGAYLILVFAAFFVFFTLGTPFLIELIRRTRQYLKMFSFWNRTVHISLYEEHVEYEVTNYQKEKRGRIKKEESEKLKKVYHYEDFYKIHEAGTRIYLTAGPTGVIIIDTTKAPSSILEAVRSLAEEDDISS